MMSRRAIELVQRKVDLPPFVIEHFMGEWQIYDTARAELVVPDKPIITKQDAENYLKTYEQPTTKMA
jgi:hypothetical protein